MGIAWHFILYHILHAAFLAFHCHSIVLSVYRPQDPFLDINGTSVLNALSVSDSGINPIISVRDPEQSALLSEKVTALTNQIITVICLQ